MLSPPPPATRHRASSTSLRPPLTLPTLASRNRSSSFVELPTVPATPPASDPSPQFPLPATHTPVGMIPALVSRTIQLVRIIVHHSSSKKPLLPSPVISPRSSADLDETYILPLSTPRKSGFGVILVPPQRLRLASSVHAPLVLVLILFPLTTGLVLFALSTLPVTFAWPRTLQDLAQLGRELSSYGQSGALPTAHVLAVLGLSATWKHAWSIPGAVLWNVLAGALFHPFVATILMTSLTALGSVVATLLATPLAPLLSRFFPRPIELTRLALEGSSVSSSSSPAWVRLAICRLAGIVPWSALNVACGVADINLYHCALGAFIGTLPWTAVTCQIGDILQTVAAESTGDGEARTISSLLATPQIIVELVFLTFLSLAPILGRKKLSKLISPVSSEATPSPQSASLSLSSMDGPPTPTSSTFTEFASWSPTCSATSLDEEKDMERIELMMEGEELVVAHSCRTGSGHSRWSSGSWSLSKPTIAKLQFPFALGRDPISS